MRKNGKNDIVKFVNRVGGHAVRFGSDYQSLVEYVGSVSCDLADALMRPRRLRWRDFAYYLDLCGLRTLPIVLGICTLMGVVVGFQAGFYMRDYGLEMLTADATAYAVLKELGPLLAAVIATGRAGSAFAAELGTMRVNDEIAALETMGIRPGRFLVVPKVLALALALPVLTVFGDMAGLFGGWLVGDFYLDIPTGVYVDRTCRAMTPVIMLLGLVKSFVFAVLIALIGCRKGMTAGADAQGVGRAATQAVVAGVFAVVISDAVMTVLFTVSGW